MWDVKDPDKLKSGLKDAYIRGRKSRCYLCKELGATIGCYSTGYI